MRTPEEILHQARTRYTNSWRDWLASRPSDGPSFPLSPPNAHTIAHDATTVATWLRTWRTWADDHPTTQLRTAPRRTLIGAQQIYTHLDLPSVDSLADLDPELATHWRTARHRYPHLAEFAVPHEQLKPHLAQIINLDGYDFDLLLRTAQWFTDHPRSGLTMRQVPVPGLHTKWLARHRRLVLALLRLHTDHTPPIEQADADQLAVHDLDLLGLRTLPAHIDVILTAPENQHSLAGIRHLRAPLEEIAALPLHPIHVLIIENKESALPIPDWPDLVIIHSLGNFLDALTAIPWIAGAQTRYWGDLDRAGFTLLSRARTRLPDITSVLMDRDTLDQHIDLAVKDPAGRVDSPDPTLTTAERETLTALANDGRPLRLEQERIPWTYVDQCLLKALNNDI